MLLFEFRIEGELAGGGSLAILLPGPHVLLPVSIGGNSEKRRSSYDGLLG